MENNWTYAWNGKADDALEKLFDLYHEKFGCTPDTYVGILYKNLSSQAKIDATGFANWK